MPTDVSKSGKSDINDSSEINTTTQPPPVVLTGEGESIPTSTPPPPPPRTWSEAADELRAQIAALRDQFLELRADLTRPDPRSGSANTPPKRAAPSPMGTLAEPDPVEARSRRVRAAAAAGDRGALLAYMRLRRA